MIKNMSQHRRFCPRGFASAYRERRPHLATFEFLCRAYVYGRVNASQVHTVLNVHKYDQNPAFMRKVHNWIRYHRRQKRLKARHGRD
jgi:hypothetical protein